MPALGPKQLSRQAGILSHMGTARSQAAYSVGFLTCLVFNPGHAVEPSGELFKNSQTQTPPGIKCIMVCTSHIF